MATDNEEQANLVIAAVNEATGTLREIQEQFESFEGSAQSLGATSVFLGGILKDVVMKAFQELKNMVKLGINEAIEAEQIQMRLAVAFKAEGAAVQISIKAINDTADSLGELVGVHEEVIAASATTLRQMTGMSSEIITRLLPGIADLSVKTGSYESATSMVARAVNGHARGLKMLGIDLDLTRDKTKNAEMIMKKLNEQFGGVAEANMQTMGGQLQAISVGWADAAKALGEYIVQSNFVKFAIGSVIEALRLLKNLLQTPGKNDPIADIKSIDEAKKMLAEYTRLYNTLLAAYKVSNNQDLLERIDAYDAYIVRLKQLIPDMEANAKKVTELEKKEKDAILKIQDDLLIARAYKNNEGRDKELAELNVWHAQELRDENLTDERRLVIEELYRVKLKTLRENWHERDLEKIISENEDIRAVRKKGEDQENADQMARWAEEDKLYYDHAHAIAGIISEVAGASVNALSGSMLALFSGSKNVLKGLEDVWKSFGNAVLSIITQLIAKLIIMQTLMALANIFTGGAATALRYAAKAVIPGLQTPEGSTRIIPGLPSMPQLVMAHGGERIGRGDSGGGLTLVVQGDYFESDDANAKIFERYHKYSRSIGA